MLPAPIHISPPTVRIADESSRGIDSAKFRSSVRVFRHATGSSNSSNSLNRHRELRAMATIALLVLYSNYIFAPLIPTRARIRNRSHRVFIFLTKLRRQVCV